MTMILADFEALADRQCVLLDSLRSAAERVRADATEEPETVDTLDAADLFVSDVRAFAAMRTPQSILETVSNDELARFAQRSSEIIRLATQIRAWLSWTSMAA